MSSRNRSAFTVVEMLVVITIIGVLAALLLPAVMMAREAARKAQCASQLGQISKAQITYASNKGYFAPARQITAYGAANSMVASYFSWVHPILPELGENALAQTINDNNKAGRDIQYEWNGATQGPLLRMRMALLICPTDPTATDTTYFEAPLSYLANVGRVNNYSTTVCGAPNAKPYDHIHNGLFEELLATTCRPAKVSMADVSNGDGASNTIMYAESLDAFTWRTTEAEYDVGLNWYPFTSSPDPWMSNSPPSNTELNSYVQLLAHPLAGKRSRPDVATDYSNGIGVHPSSKHGARGFNAAMCDGSVRFISDGINYSVYALLMTSKGRNAYDPNATPTPPLPQPYWQKAKLDGIDF